MIQKDCQNCGLKFEPLPTSMGKYCSIKCSSESQKVSVFIKCAHCGEQFETKKWRLKEGRKYCSKECSILGRVKDKKDKGKYINCDGCGKLFYRKNHKVGRCENSYCTHECFSKDKKLYPKTLILRHRIRCKNRVREEIKNVSDVYIKKLSRQIYGVYHIPKELIELKRLNIKRKRKIKEITHGNSQ